MIVVENAAVQETSLKSRFLTFRCQKCVKKGYIEMTKKFYLETFKKCPGPLHFPLLDLECKMLSKDSYLKVRLCSGVAGKRRQHSGT